MIHEPDWIPKGLQQNSQTDFSQKEKEKLLKIMST
jgi:hypothetical protein